MFIQKIVKVIGDKVNRMVLSISPYLIGIDARVKNINVWLQDRSTDIGIVAICGMGGIGKTTIAKFVFNLNFERFDGSSFLENMREISEEANGLVRLQRQLLSDILKGRKIKIWSVDEGIVKIKDAICCKRVLVVLDDVDQVDQLDAVLGMRDWFYPGSKIIITTRHSRLLKAQEAYKIHNVEKLNDDESYELFSWHAFGQDHPTEDYMELSKRVVQHCRGLPLALQVFGSSLFGKIIDAWESALKNLEAIPDSQIVAKLKISYDSLQDDHDKNLFLEIACFFIGKNKDYTVTILDECDFYTTVGIQSLMDRCLLVVNKDNKLVMHQLLRDMGREIIRQESPEEPGKRTRLWDYKDSFNVLRDKTGTETIEGLNVNFRLLKEDKTTETVDLNNSREYHSKDYLDGSMFYNGNSLKRRRLGFFSWLPINSASKESFSTSNKVEFNSDAFSKMHRLRLLQLNNVWLTGGYKEFPKKLRWLCWHEFPSKSIPTDFPLESLVALDMRYSSLEQGWKGTRLLRLLKVLNLSHSRDLTNTPNFSQLPNLQRLILKYCINLIEIHESIGELEGLVFLNLKGCKNLRKLPGKIDHLSSLEKLILSGCSKLNELSIELSKMQSLTVLHADRTLNQIPSSTGEVKSWHSLFSLWVPKPRKSPDSISFSLASLSRLLVSLSLANCNLFDDAIPRDLGSLSLLQNLTLSGNPICSLPESIRGLTMLQSLELEHCRELQSLPELPVSVRNLNVYECRSLEMLTNLPNLLRSLDLLILRCDKLGEVQELFKLEPIRNFDAEIINILGLFNWEILGKVEVELYNNLTLSKRKGPIQGLYEFGIFSTSLPGSEVPGWFSYKSIESSICFNVPSLPNIKIQGLNVCVVYANSKTSSNDSRNKFWDEFYIRTTNKTKDLKWAYSPTFNGIPDDGKDMTWLSHWKIGSQLEGGDGVNVSVFLWAAVQLKEFGVHVVFEQEEEGAQHETYPCCQDVINGGDLSAYQVRRGSYFLCHHDFDIQQKFSTDDGWTSNGWYDFLFGDSVKTTGVGPVSTRFM